jgi:septin family protein
MTEERIKQLAGLAFLNSPFGHVEHSRNIEKRDTAKQCYFGGYIQGVKDYAEHLFNNGSIFDIVKSIRETAEWENWTPLVGWELTVLEALKFYGKRGELKQKTYDWKKKMEQRMNDNIRIVRHEYEERIKENKERIKSLEASVLTQNVRELEKENKSLTKEIKAKDEEIAELNNLLASLTRQGYMPNP